MQTITCKKCGATFDASLGECPVCGAVYYIIGEQPTQSAPPVQTAAPFGHDPAKLENAGSGDIFTTHEVSSEPDMDATRAFKTVQMPEDTPHRPAAPTPVRQAPPSRTANTQRRQPELTAQEAEQKKAKSKLIIGAISLLALLTLVLTIMSGAFNFGDKSDAARMENVVGQTMESATKVLENLGLVVKTQMEPSDELAGTVIKQSIKEGKKIKDGQEVTLTISTGAAASKDDEPAASEAPISAPDLKGKTYDQAYYEATKAGLLVTTGEGVFDPDVPEGSVVSQSPKAGSSLSKGDIITLNLSKGPEASPSPETVSITALAGAGGSISPRGAVTAEINGSITFTITPNDGFTVKEVKVDGQDVGAVTTYTFSNLTESHTIYAVFTLAPLE